MSHFCNLGSQLISCADLKLFFAFDAGCLTCTVEFIEKSHRCASLLATPNRNWGRRQVCKQSFCDVYKCLALSVN